MEVAGSPKCLNFLPHCTRHGIWYKRRFQLGLCPILKTLKHESYHSIFLSSSFGLQKSTFLREGSQALAVCPSDKSSMKTEMSMKQ
jgi:hypothetical protein